MWRFTFRAVLALFIFLCMSSAYGQTKVVVIPLGGDDAATTWRGSWVAGTAYKKSDIIEFDGSSYIAVSNHQSDLANIPPDESFWDLVAAAGANGMDGSAADAVAAVCLALSGNAVCDLLDAISAIAASTYKVGDLGPAGGRVFYITNNGLQGLEAAPTDLGSSPWGCNGTGIGTATAIGTGAANTAAIVAGCLSAEVTAAEVADIYSFNSFTDWYLPSKDELNQLYLQRAVVGGFTSGPYWSSSETNDATAWLQDFGDGVQSNNLKNTTEVSRAVRAF